MIRLRDHLKRAVETALVVSGGAAAGRRSHSAGVLVIAYHNVVPDGREVRGDRSLHISQKAFGQQLDMLRRTHEIIRLSDALSGAYPATQRGTRPRVIITFDDAYSGAMTAGVKELTVRRLPATFFVTPGFLNGRPFWWDLLADPVRGLDPEVRRRALTEGQGMHSQVLALSGLSNLSTGTLPEHACGASKHELDTALQQDSISVAAHTWDHSNLTAISDSELRNELTRPLAWLRQFGDKGIPVLSYPYGLADSRVQDAARDAGYAAGFMIDGGWAQPVLNGSFTIPRLNVPAGVTRNGFVLRTAGLKG